MEKSILPSWKWKTGPWKISLVSKISKILVGFRFHGRKSNPSQEYGSHPFERRRYAQHCLHVWVAQWESTKHLTLFFPGFPGWGWGVGGWGFGCFKSWEVTFSLLNNTLFFRKGTEGGLLKEGGRKKKKKMMMMMMMMKMMQPGMDDSTDCWWLNSCTSC